MANSKSEQYQIDLNTKRRIKVENDIARMKRLGFSAKQIAVEVDPFISKELLIEMILNYQEEQTK